MIDQHYGGMTVCRRAWLRAGQADPPPRRRIMYQYWACIGVLTAIGGVCAGCRTVTWNLAGLTAVAAILLGPRFNRSEQRAAWALFGLAGLLLLVSDDVSFAYHRASVIGPRPSIVDFVGVIAYPLAVAAALLLLVVRRSPSVVWASLIDSVIVLSGLSLMAWTLLVSPLEGAARPSTTVSALAITYSLGEVMVVIVLGRLLFPDPAQQKIAAWLLVAGATGMLAADIVFSLAAMKLVNVHRTAAGSVAAGALWLIGIGAWGAAALSDTAAAIERPAGPARPPAPLTRALLLAAASLMVPAVLLVYAGEHRTIDKYLVAACSLVISLLLVLRLNLALAETRRRLRTEEALRVAAGRLVGAAEAGEILAAVLDAAARYPSRRAAEVAVCAIDGDRLLTAVGTAPTATQRTELGTDPVAWVNAEFADRDHTVIAPRTHDKAAGQSLALGIAGSRNNIIYKIDLLEVLVSQASLALSRLALTREVSRRDGEAYFRSLVDNASDMIMIVEQSGRVRYASPSAAVLFGDTDTAAASLPQLFGPENAARIDEALARPPGTGSTGVAMDWALRRPGIGLLDFEVHCADLRSDPTVSGLVLTLRDVTAQRRLERELRYHAYYDTLTGLGNRLQFARRVELAMARAKTGGPTPVVLLLDIDDFRELNEVRGREIGDLVLIAVADRLANCIGYAEIGRLGSDSFGVLTEPSTAGPDACDALAARLVRELSRPFDLPIGPVTLTVSIGTAVTHGQARSDEVIRNANLALEAAKADGRRSWRRYEPAMLEARVEHAALREDLEASIEEHAFVLHYQPVVGLTAGTITAFEALVRWRHPARGLIGPERFIPLAEETGLIVPLGRWILRQAAQDAARLRALPSPGGAIRVAVNVSTYQFAIPGLIDEVNAALRDSGVDAGAFMVELTESALVRREGRTAQDLRALKQLGVALVIDDFGTGYSSLSYLQDLPFDGLKIDRSFVAEIATSPRRAELIRGIIRIADTLGLYVVGEGVETVEQRELLSRAGCRYGQGYLFSRPVPIGVALRLLHAGGFGALTLRGPSGEFGPARNADPDI